MRKAFILIVILSTVRVNAQIVITLADTAHVLYTKPDRTFEGDTQVFIRNKARYTTPWKVYYDKNKNHLAYESFISGDTCITFDFWRTNGQLKKKTKFLKDTSRINPIHAAVFHWYYEERYCSNGQQTYKGYPNNKTSQKVISYYCNGKKKLEYTSNADNSAPEGLFIVWYENGQKQEERNYKNGVAHGLWTYWTKHGKVEKQENYIDGKQVGIK